MVRPREFDRDEALRKAIEIFWARGFAGSSMGDLLRAMGIGRQSLYDTFGSKRQLYLASLTAYQRDAALVNIDRLSGPRSPLEGIRDLLHGLIAEDERVRQLGCMGVGSIGEFGAVDSELVALRRATSSPLSLRITERIKEGQRLGEIDPELDPFETSLFVQMTMVALQIAARGGSELEELRSTARFATDRLRTKSSLP